MKEKYINPFTDFGFKKIFGEEANKDLLIDWKNVIDTAVEEAVEKAVTDKSIEIAKNLKSIGISNIDISKATGLSENEINNL